MAEGKETSSFTKDNSITTDDNTLKANSAEPSYWLERRPSLAVLCSDIRTNRWHQLGIQLQLDENSLTEIDKDYANDTNLKRTKMFELWLKTQPQATNRQLLAALRLKVMGEDRLAKEYEERIKTDPSLTKNDSISHEKATSPPVQSPSDTDKVISTMVHRASQVLTVQALQLQEKYHKLLELIQDLAQYSNVELIKNKLSTILKEKSLYQSHTIAPYCQQICAITTVDEAFTFMIDNNFVGYLNFQLLKELSSKRICGEAGSKKARDKVSKYEKRYRKFLEEPSFSELIKVFDENPHLNPSTIVGLPILVVTLTMKWRERGKKDLEKWLPFLKENRPLLQSMGYKCILITYAVFPIDLLNIMTFLEDPENTKRLKENEISVETPSHTLEIAQLLREAGEETVNDSEDSPDEDEPITENMHTQDQLMIIINSLKSELTQVKLQLAETNKKHEKQRLADNQYWTREINQLRENYELEFHNLQMSCQRQIEKIDKTTIQNQTKNEEQINAVSDEVDDLSSEVQMINRELGRHARIKESTIKGGKIKKEDIKKLSTQFEESLEKSLEKSREKPLERKFDSTDSGLDSTGLNSRTSSISFGPYLGIGEVGGGRSLPRNVIS